MDPDRSMFPPGSRTSFATLVSAGKVTREPPALRSKEYRLPA
jgi:hypothetical protein